MTSRSGSSSQGCFGTKRINAHTLLFFLVLLLKGLVLSRMYSPRAGLQPDTLAAGVLSHQLLDAK